ncbi:MAG: phage tail tape measure protein [Rhodobacterales bacterium CG2_30_65_12]|nr:MAG: phage tail tape measure protein [Rhodobacterales bacterium CG2_30_65_12]
MSKTLTSSLVVKLIDQVSGPARKIGQSLTGISEIGQGGKTDFASRLATSIAANERALSRARMGMVDAAAGFYAIRAAIRAPVQAAAEFESAMADVRKVVDDFEDPVLFDKFKADLKAMSLEIPLAINDLAAIAAAAGEAGFAGQDLLKVTEAAAKIGVAFGISADQAGDALPQLMNSMGLTLDQAILLADAMNHLSNNMASGAPDILAFSQKVGGAAITFGFSAEQAAAFGSAMIATGYASDVAGTSFLNMGKALTRGESATTRQRKAMKALGLDAVEVAEAMQEDAVGTTLKVIEALKGLPDAQRAAMMSDLFGDEARALAGLVVNTDVLRQSLGFVGDEADYAGSAFEEFGVRSQTYEANVQRFDNALTNLKISIGNALLPALTDLMEAITPAIQGMTEFADAHPDLISNVAKAAAGIVAFKAGVATLKYLGLMGRGTALSALSLLSTGIVGVGNAATTEAGRVEVASNRIVQSLMSARVKALGFAGLAAYMMTQVPSDPDEASKWRAGNRERLERNLRKLPGIGGLMNAYDSAYERVQGEPAPEPVDLIDARRPGTVEPVPESLPADVAKAMELVQSYRANGNVPTEQMRAELGEYAGSLRTEIADLQAQIESIADGPLGETLAAPMRQELQSRQAELAEIEQQLAAAEQAAAELGEALALIGGLDVAPQINTESLDRAVQQALTLDRTLRGLPSSAGGGGAAAKPRGRASGGSVRAGSPYLVGEEGPELVEFGRSGWVQTARRTREIVAGVSSARPGFSGPAPSAPSVSIGGITVHIASADNADDVARRIGDALRDELAGLHIQGAF